MESGTKMEHGAKYSQNSCEFRVWAPYHNCVSLVFPQEKQVLEMAREDKGYWQLKVDGIKPEVRYAYRLNGQVDRPDPASHFQPNGVFGSSAIVDHSSFVWNDDDWNGISLKDMIIYELHVGAFTREGTFAEATKRAEELSKTGITAVELMPISQFSGNRNWGYDTTFPYAVQNTYGGPDELKRLIQEFHLQGIAVILDVVYNHFGPEGNFFEDYGPYFLYNRNTPWGPAINFDGPSSLPVRTFFIENAVHWFQNYHVDGLRLDAVYAIIDNSPKHFLKELSETVENLDRRKLLLIAENDKLDAIIIKNRNNGGFGLNAIWHDDLHHSVHAVLTAERNWYYASYGTIEKIIDALQREYAVVLKQIVKKSLEVRSLEKIDPKKLVVFSQNHDQIGNRPLGERLVNLAGLEAAKLAAAMVILSQNTPLLFMGEEYGENAPFLFFTDYSDRVLGRKVQLGRKRESARNGWKSSIVNSQSSKAFASSKLSWQKRFTGDGKKILEYYQNLFRLRKDLSGSHLQAKVFSCKGASLLIVQRQNRNLLAAIIANFGKQDCQYKFQFGEGDYMKVLDSTDAAWAGSGSGAPVRARIGEKLTIHPLSVSVYIHRKGEKND